MKSAKAVQKPTNGASSGSASKTDVRHWHKRVKRPFYTMNGERHQSPHYSIQIQFRGRRESFALGTGNRSAAAAKAKKIYLCLVASGWEETSKQFKENEAKKTGLTVGDYLHEIETKTDLSTRPRTLKSYRRKFLQLVSEIHRVVLPDGVSKNDYVNGGSEQWRSELEKVKLSRLTPEAIGKWRIKRVKSAKGNPDKFQKAKRATNSILRNSKSLFSKKILRQLSHLELPDPLPFEGVDFFKEGTMRYQSEINPVELMIQARQELGEANAEEEAKSVKVRSKKGGFLAPDSPAVRRLAKKRARTKQEAFKILVFALCAGLRRDEIDKLKWEQISFDKGLVRISTTDVFHPKADSAGEIGLDDEVLALLQEWKTRSPSAFVVSGVAPKPSADYHHYRSDKHHKTLVKWLRSKGITSPSPIHSLRKEFGSIICEKGGIYAASRLLRHSKIQITADYYTDNRGMLTVGLGSSLNEE